MLARDLELGVSRVMPNNPIGGHLESVFKSGMSNKYCWGHLKWNLSPFVSNIVIWGQSLRHRKRVQHSQKSIVTLNAWIVTSQIQ